MARTKISEFSSTPGNNTDIDGININEGCAPSGINDAIRELMSQLKDFQAGTAGDSFNGPVGTTTAAAGAFTTLSASSTVSGTGFSTYLASPPAIGGTAAAAGSFTTLSASSTVTLSGGTANGVLYLNASKVATSGTALTFDGGSFKLNTAGNFVVGNVAGYDVLFTTPQTTGNGVLQFVLNFAGTAYEPLTQDASYWVWRPSGTETMRLTSTGLGIGTSSPATKLEVSGSAAVARVSGTAGTVPQLQLSSSGVVNWSLRSNNDSGSDFTIYQDSTQRLKIDSSGNLGIGTSSPSAKLNVVGTGDMSVIFESAGTSNAASLIVRSGNGTTSGLYAYARFVNNDTNAQDWRIGTYGTNNLSIVNAKAGTTPVVLDSSGNLGLGVTPNTWSVGKALELGFAGNALWGNSSDECIVTQAAYYNAGWKYARNGAATHYSQYNGTHRWFNAASGTAGNAISFTQAMTLDASGNLVIGDTSASYRLDVKGSTGNGIAYRDGTVINYLGTTGSNLGYLGTLTNHPVAFLTNATERARIDTTGNLLVGQTATGLTNSNSITLEAPGGAEVINHNNSSPSGSYYVIFGYNGGLIGSITQNGTTGVLYNINSDARLKENIADADSASDLIDAIQVRKFDWKSNGSHQRYGMVAQELFEVAPEAVSKPADDEEMMGVDYSKLVPMLVKEIQQLRVRVAQLEKGN